MREGPDPTNFQGQEEDESSGIWISWLNTCSPIQRTRLRACKRRKETKVRSLVRLIFTAPVRMFRGTYICEVVGSLG